MSKYDLTGYIIKSKMCPMHKQFYYILEEILIHERRLKDNFKIVKIIYNSI